MDTSGEDYTVSDGTVKLRGLQNNQQSTKYSRKTPKYIRKTVNTADYMSHHCECDRGLFLHGTEAAAAHDDTIKSSLAVAKARTVQLS